MSDNTTNYNEANSKAELENALGGSHSHVKLPETVDFSQLDRDVKYLNNIMIGGERMTASKQAKTPVPDYNPPETGTSFLKLNTSPKFV